MALKSFNPVTPSLRGTVLVARGELWKGKPVKALTVGKSSSGGRNNHGHITIRFRGGGHKQSYRIVDFRRRKFDVPAIVQRLEYDPNRTAFIALIKYQDGELAYILAPQRLRAGDQVLAAQRADIKPGNAMPLATIPVGTIVHNLEMKPGAGGKLARAAGQYAQLVGKDAGYAQIKLMSGEVRIVRSECMATIGAVSNPDNANVQIGKAGRKRWLGRRPHNRGVVMNPVDHPHGGGEGRSSGGRHPVTPWGKPTKGYKTRANKRTDRMIIRRRNKGEGLTMARSVWKGPFVDGYLLAKAEASRSSGRNEIIRIWSRRSTILPQFVGLTFGVYNGRKFLPVLVNENMVGHKFGEFSPTRTFTGHSGDKKARRG